MQCSSAAESPTAAASWLHLVALLRKLAWERAVTGEAVELVAPTFHVSLTADQVRYYTC